MRYDAVIIGGGPAGLMAAKTAAERGLEVALIDVKKEIPEITRPCGMMLHMDPGLHNIMLSVEPGKLIFNKNKFSVKYSGDLYDLYYRYFFSGSGYKYCMVNKNPCLGKVIDKEKLLRGLLEETKKLGVNVCTETKGIKAENTTDGVKVNVRSKGQLAWIKAKIAVAADGFNSLVTKNLGLNENRELIGRIGPFLGYVVEGVDCPFQNAYMFFRGPAYSPTSVVNTIPRACGNDVWLVLPRTEEGLKYFLKKGRVANWFTKAKVIQKGGYSGVMYSPIESPVAGKVLIVGDAAGTYEVEIHGALACGYNAGRVIAKSIIEEKESVLREYEDWWRKSIEFIRNPSIVENLMRAATQKRSFGKYFTDDEVDYLFSLVDNELFPGVMNPFKIYDSMIEAFLKHQEVIEKERPLLLRKIEEWIEMPTEKFKSSRSVFSYRLIK